MDRPSPKKRKNSRKSLGRRVSFAPDAQLETMHLYLKVRPAHLCACQQSDRSKTVPLSQQLSEKVSPAHLVALQEEYRNTPEAKRARASAETVEESGLTSPDYHQYDPDIWGNSNLPPALPGGVLSPGGSPGSTMDITNQTADRAGLPFPQPGLDSPSAIPKPLGDITAGLKSFGDLIADMATTEEIGWEQAASYDLGGSITAGVPALSTLLEEDEEGRTSAYGDENASVNMELTADTGLQPEVFPCLVACICKLQSHRCIWNRFPMSLNHQPQMLCTCAYARLCVFQAYLLATS